ncbi:MAG: hypothetical protein AB1449_11905 [Chloroflexota bacterium]
MPRRLPRVIHPLLLALYPVAALLAHNIAQVQLQDAIRPALAAVGLATVLMAASRLVLGDWQRAGLLASLAVLLFFSYGHVYDLLRQAGGMGATVGRHRYLLPVWLVLLALGARAVVRIKGDARRATTVLNAISALALAVPLLQVAYFEIRLNLPTNPSERAGSLGDLRLPEGDAAPDIYYIILDGYTRVDVLERAFDFDNSSFLDSLVALGFFVAEDSRSNYAQTELSLASSLNMDYLEQLGVPLDPNSTDRTSLRPLLVHSAVREKLAALGYRVVAFESGYNPTEWPDADVYLARRNEMPLLGGVSGFESLLIQTSGAMILSDAAGFLPGCMTVGLEQPLEAHRQQVLFALDQLPGVASIPGPKFVFVHLVAPHAPFVFDAEGGQPSSGEQPQGAGLSVEYTPEAYARGYTEEITYLNRRILDIVSHILAQPGPEPVIILQADHGADPVSMADRMAILNAYHLPHGEGSQLYPAISPVNSFRVVFNRFFGTAYPMLEDRSYFSEYTSPYDLTLVQSQ